MRPRRRAVGFSFRIASSANGFGFTQRAEAGGFSLARGLFDVGVGLKFGNVHPLLRADDLLLDVRQRSLPHQLLALLLRCFLHLTGLAMFFGNFPVLQRFHQRGGRVAVADECVDGLHLVSVEPGADMLGNDHL